ncbi:unnamed protein product [Lota lota]
MAILSLNETRGSDSTVPERLDHKEDMLEGRPFLRRSRSMGLLPPTFNADSMTSSSDEGPTLTGSCRKSSSGVVRTTNAAVCVDGEAPAEQRCFQCPSEG